MKILRFNNEKKLLKKLENVAEVKANKANFYFAPEHRIKWQSMVADGLAQECLFKDTTICAIPIAPDCNADLFVIDCDNLFSGEFILKRIVDFDIETLITQSPYGYHIYFYDADPLPLKPIRQNNEGLENLAIDFFNVKTHKEHIIFDGAANPYYKIHQLSAQEPCEIPRDFKEWLRVTFELLRTEHNIGVSVNAKKLFKPNRGRWEKFIEPALKKGKLDLTTFIPAFEYNREGIEYQNRNETLNRICAWAGICGYFESYEQWVEFALIANRTLAQNGFFGGKEALSESEIKATICAKSKWERLFFTRNETVELQLKTNEIKQNLTNYIALNLSATTTKSMYLHILQKNSNNVKIMEILNQKILKELCKNDSELFEHYIFYDKNGKETLKETNFVPIRILNSYDKTNMPLYSTGSDGVRILNPQSLNRNGLVGEIMNGKDNIELIGENEFRDLPFMRVFYTNLAPDSDIAEKFLHDLAYCLRNNVGLVNVPFFWDIYGGSGKGLVLNTIIDNFFFNKSYDHNKFANEISLDVPIASPRISAKAFVENRFNAEFASNAVIIDEDGFNANEAIKYNKAFASKLKEVAKAEFLRIEKKGVNPYLRPNNVFIIRCLNSLLNPIPQNEANTRIYVSRCEKKIQDRELTAIYNDKQRIIREDLPKILKYLLINYPNDAKKFVTLPTGMAVDNFNEDYFRDDYLVFLQRFSHSQELTDETLFVEWYNLFFIKTPIDDDGVGIMLKSGVLESLLNIYFNEQLPKSAIDATKETISILTNMIIDKYRNEEFKAKFYSFGLYKTENSKDIMSAEIIFRKICKAYNPMIMAKGRLRAEIINIINIYGRAAKLAEEFNPF